MGQLGLVVEREQQCPSIAMLRLVRLQQPGQHGTQHAALLQPAHLAGRPLLTPVECHLPQVVALPVRQPLQRHSQRRRLAPDQPVAQLMKLMLTQLQLLQHGRFEPADVPLLAAFGLIEGQDGLIQQPAGILLLRLGHPEPTGKIEAALPGHELEMEQAYQLMNAGFQRAIRAGQHHRELVATEPVGVAIVGLLQLVRHRLQQPITDLIAEQIIDLLEALEIEHHQGASLAGMQSARELLLQGAAVAKPGQGIEQREPAIRQVGANEGGHQGAAGQQQYQLPDLQPEQAAADLADRTLPLLAGEDLIPYLLDEVGLAGDRLLQASKLGPLAQRTGLHLGFELLDLLEQSGQRLAEPVPLARLGSFAADEKDIEPVPQQIVIQAQGLHPQPAGPVELQIVEETLGFQHHLADVPVDIAVEGIDQLLLPMLQIETAARGEQKQQRHRNQQQFVAG